MENKEGIESRWRRIGQHIEKLQQDSLVPPSKVTLIAVSKGQPEGKIEALLGLGQRVFGENRLQEAHARWSMRREHYKDLELHLIGSLQSNKVHQVMELFDVIHTIDRRKLVDEIVQQLRSSVVPRCKRFFVQVNTAEEPQKGGVAPGELAALLGYCRESGLEIEGLMCIPPEGEPPAPHFALLAKMAREHALAGLSMGMSGDYETAVRQGATHVRVGTALFGARD